MLEDSRRGKKADIVLFIKGIGIEYIWKGKDKKRHLGKIAREIGMCRRCHLSLSRINPVPGDGNPDASLLFVGEAPGEKEDEEGFPFVGPSGMKLNSLLNMIGITRKDVYITNIVKCRPPNNRDPEEEEIGKCIGYLERQIDIISPSLIVTLGRIAGKTLIGVDRITKARGNIFFYRGVKLIPTYHPSYILRNPGKEKEMMEDFERIKEVLNAP